MRKLILFISAFLVAGGIAFVALEPLSNDKTLEPLQASDISETGIERPVSLVENGQTRSEEIDTSEVLTQQVISTMKDSQKEKYRNLPDSDREEMIEILSATDESSEVVSSGARKYFDLVNDDKKLEQLDAEIEEKIALLNRLPGDKETKSSATSATTAQTK